MHEMLAGRKLFHGESISETLAAVLMAEPDMGALPPQTPLRVRSLIERCLRKDAQSRLRDIGDARLVIEQALAGHEWKTAGVAAEATQDLEAAEGVVRNTRTNFKHTTANKCRTRIVDSVTVSINAVAERITQYLL